MTEKEPKIHWQRLRDLIEQTRNGKGRIYWQDGLPISIEDVETARKHIDLTKDTD